MNRFVAGTAERRTAPFAEISRAAAVLGLACLCLSPAIAQEKKPAAPAEAAKPVQSEAGKPSCDAACARQAVPAAVQACAPAVERQAPSDFEWMNRPAGTIFQQAEPPTGEGAVVKFRGDSVRFLSPQGQWVRVTYECDYDAATQSVRGVKVRLGRIDGKGANEGSASRPSAGANPSPTAQNTPSNTAQNPAQGTTQVKRPRPSEPSDVEIRQVSPSARQ